MDVVVSNQLSSRAVHSAGGGGSGFIPELLRLSEVSQILGMSETTVKILLRRGQLQSCKVLGMRRIKRVEVERFLSRLGGGDE